VKDRYVSRFSPPPHQSPKSKGLGPPSGASEFPIGPAAPRRDRAERLITISLLHAACIAVLGPTLSQIGHNRYVPDFVLIWLCVIAPWTDGPRRRWFTLGCLGWSVFFFYMVTTG
jgi:hypothetical protein